MKYIIVLLLIVCLLCSRKVCNAQDSPRIDFIVDGTVAWKYAPNYLQPHDSSTNTVDTIEGVVTFWDIDEFTGLPVRISVLATCIVTRTNYWITTSRRILTTKYGELNADKYYQFIPFKQFQTVKDD